MLYPEENNGLIDVSFIQSPELFTTEDIYRPGLVPNAVSLEQAEYGQVGRGINDSAVDKTMESDIIKTDSNRENLYSNENQNSEFKKANQKIFLNNRQ